MTSVPNLLTMARLALAPAVFLLILHGSGDAVAAAAALFLLGGLLDKLDGWLARRLGQVSAFGIIWDPVADKVLVLGAMLAASSQGLLPLWFVYLCVARDLIVSGMRAGSELPAEALAADAWGKWKTRLQFAAVLAALVQPFLAPPLAQPWPWVLGFLLAAAAFTTVASAVRYARRYRPLRL